MGEFTQLLNAAEQGDSSAAARLLPLVYDEPRRLAAQKLSRGKPGQTLQATALVHEAWLRLVCHSQLLLGRPYFVMELVKGVPITDCCDENNLSTSYVASLEEPADFMLRLRQEAIRRRMAAALLMVLLGDGAAWIWEQGQKCFPMSFQILELYHALEHLSTLPQLLEAQPDAAKALWQSWREQLLADGVAEVLGQARQRAAKLSGEAAEPAAKEIGYFHSNQSRMLYGAYRALGFF